MVLTKIKCIHCESKEVVKNGKRATGIQSLKCKNCGRCFQESFLNYGAKPETKRMKKSMSVNGSGIREISRVLKIINDTVMKTLKKRKRSSRMLTQNTYKYWTGNG